MIEHRVLEDLLDVFIADLGRVLSWGSQMLSTIHCQVNLCVSKVLGFVIGKKQDGTVSDTTAHLGLVFALLVTVEDFLVEVGTSDGCLLFLHGLRHRE